MFAACDGSVLLQCHGQCWVTAVCIIQFENTRCCPSSLSKLVYIISIPIYIYIFIYLFIYNIKLVTSTVSLVLFTQLAYILRARIALTQALCIAKSFGEYFFQDMSPCGATTGCAMPRWASSQLKKLKVHTKCHPPVVFLHVHLIN